MAIHNWKTAPAGFFHHFHQAWSGALCDALNAGRLPSGYFALIEQTTLGVAPPRTRFSSQSTEEEAYASRANRIAIHTSSDGVVAIIEIVSPGNKSSRNAMKSFVAKAIRLLRRGVNLLIIDLFPPTSRDRQGIHEKIWSELTDEAFELPEDKPLTLAAYAAGVPIRAFVEPVALGDCLPEMPLFLDTASYVLAPLEESYQLTWDACPEEFREQITGPSPMGSGPGEGSG